MGTFAEFREKNKQNTAGTSSSVLSFSEFKQSQNGAPSLNFSVTGQPTSTPVSVGAGGDGVMHHAQRNNNPGNLKFAGQPGAIKAPDSDFAQFATPQEGFNALIRDLTAKVEGRSVTGIKPTDTILDLIKVYAPASDNNPVQNYAAHVARKLGVTVNTQLSNISNRTHDLAMAMAEFEDPGFFAQLTGAKTASAEAPKQTPKEQQGGGAFSQFRQQRSGQFDRAIAQVERGYLTDVMGTGFRFPPTMKEIDPSLPTEEDVGTINTLDPMAFSSGGASTPAFIPDQDAVVASNAAKKWWGADLVDYVNVTYSAAASMFANIVGTTFKAVGEQGLEDSTVEIWEEDSVMRDFDQWLDEKVNQPMVDFGNSIVKTSGATHSQLAQSFQDGKDGTTGREALAMWAEATGSYGSAAAVWAITRNKNAAVAYFTAAQMADTYNSAREAGKTPSESIGIAGQTGAAAFVLEKWGLDFMAATFVGRSVFKRMANAALGMTGEIVQEEVQQVVNNIIEKRGFDESRDIFEGWYETAFATSLPAFMMSLFFPAAAKGRLNIINEIQKKAGVDETTAQTAWRAMQYSTGELLNTLRLRGLEIQDVSGAKRQPDVVLGDQKAPGAERFDFTNGDGETVSVFGKKVGETDAEIRVEFTNQDGQRVIQVVPKDQMKDTGRFDLTEENIDAYFQEYKEQQDVKMIKQNEARKRARGLNETTLDKKRAELQSKRTELDAEKENLRMGIEIKKDALLDIKGLIDLAGKDLQDTTLSEVQHQAMRAAAKDPYAKNMTQAEAYQILRDQGKSETITVGGKEKKVKKYTSAQVRAARLKKRADIDSAVSEYGFADMDEAQEGIEAYYRSKKDIAEYKESARQNRAERGELRNEEVKQKEIDKLVSEETSKTKRQEQVVAKRQVDVEKRETKRQVTRERQEATQKLNQQREELVTMIENQQGQLKERKARLYAYIKERLPKDMQARARQLVDNLHEPKIQGREWTAKKRESVAWNEIKAFARIRNMEQKAVKKQLRNQITATVKKLLKSPSVSVDYKNKIAALMEFYEMRGHTNKKMRELNATREWINQKIANGEEVTMPEGVLNELDMLMRKQFDDISIRELQNILAKIEILGQVGMTKRALIINKYEGVKEALKETLIDSANKIEAHPLFKDEIQKGQKDTRTFGQKMHDYMWQALNAAQRMDYVLSPMDVIMDVLDGAVGTYDGAHMRHLKGRIDADHNYYLNLKDFLTKRVHDKAQEYKLTEQNYERMGIVAAYEQEGGMEKLKNLGWTEEQVKEIKLTKEEREVLTDMQESMDSQFPAVQKLMRELYNEDVQKVKNYFPWLSDHTALDEVEVYKRFGADVEQLGVVVDEQQQKKTTTKTIGHKFAISREGAGGQRIQLNAMQVYAKHIDNVAYFRAVQRDVKMLYEIVNSPEYKEAAGDRGTQMVLEWLSLVARKGGGANTIPFIDMIRRNVSTGVLGLKLTSIAIQPTALIDGMGMTGVLPALYGSKEISLNGEARAFVMQFPEIRDRTGGEFAIRDLLDNTKWQRMQKIGFTPLQKLDMITAMSVALGAYKNNLDARGIDIDYTKSPDKEAMQYAEMVVRRTQSSSIFKDLPLALSTGAGFGHNTSFSKLVLQFQTFLLTRWSRVRHDAMRVGWNTRSPKQVAGVMAPIVVASLAASGIRMSLKYALRDPDDEEEWEKELQRGFAYEMMGTVPFMGNLVGAYTYDAGLVPVVDILQSLPADLNSALTSKEPETRTRAWARVITDAGMIAGVPGSVQAQQTSQDYLPKVGEGDKKKKKSEKKKKKKKD